MGGDAHPCDTRLMYRPHDGSLSWGAYYMTAPSSWLVYDALLDFFYSPLDGILRFNPAVDGRFAVVHPLFWGIGEKVGSRISLNIKSLFTKRGLKVVKLEIPAGQSAFADGVGLSNLGHVGDYNLFRYEGGIGTGSEICWDIGSGR